MQQGYVLYIKYGRIERERERERSSERGRQTGRHYDGAARSSTLYRAHRHAEEPVAMTCRARQNCFFTPFVDAGTQGWKKQPEGSRELEEELK